ncbi:MAG: ArsR family transcriptional regulator [Candidatus Thorarchaeota archaeon]
MFDDIDDFDWDEDEFDSDDEDPDSEKLEDLEDELSDKEDELSDLEDELHDSIKETRETVDETKDEMREKLQEIAEMRHELEEFRRMKEELRREIQDARRFKEERFRRGQRLHESGIPRPPPPPRPPKVPRAPRRAAIVDFSPLTEDLEDMMEGLGEQLEMALKNVENIKIPHMRFSKKARRKGSRRSKNYEKISPERVARVIGPLGSEERLKILDFLKEGGKTFNDLEQQTGKTGSSLTHHLTPLVDAGYVIKGEVRGTYYVTVEGRLAYRLAQWLTNRLEEALVASDKKNTNEGSQDLETDEGDCEVVVHIDEDEDEEEDV